MMTTFKRQIAKRVNRVLPRRVRIFIPPTHPQEIVDNAMVLEFQHGNRKLYPGIYHGVAVDWRVVEYRGYQSIQVAVVSPAFNLPKWVAPESDAAYGFTGCSFVRFVK